MSSERVVIIGSGALAREIGHHILSERPRRYQIVGFIDEDPRRVGESVINPTIIGTYWDLSRIVIQEKISTIIVALSERRGRLPVDSLLDCKVHGVDVVDGLSFYEGTAGKILVDDLKPSYLIFSRGFDRRAVTQSVKRVMDIICSVVGLVIASPFFLFLPILIKRDSPGPVFYRQERVGEKGARFTLLKFRSMREDAESQTGPVWANDKDPRVTRIGRIMRKFRIDEIPQMINVLKGEMSFVGPRPERPEFVEQLKKEIPYYALRHSVKPGITGWAQVKYRYGASVEDAHEKLRYDLYYIKNLSILLDLLIMVETVKIVLSRKGAW